MLSSYASLTSPLPSFILDSSCLVSSTKSFGFESRVPVKCSPLKQTSNKKSVNNMVVSQIFQNVATVENVGSEKIPSSVFDKNGSVSAKGRPLKVLIAGAGIGGLVLALALKNRGIDVMVTHFFLNKS
jgi:hypothetical protein